MLLVMIAYFAVLLFGKYFLPEDNEILRSMNVFSQEEAPNRLVNLASLAILTLSASTILRFFIARMAENSALTKRTGRAVIELLGNFVKYSMRANFKGQADSDRDKARQYAYWYSLVKNDESYRISPAEDVPADDWDGEGAFAC